ncbi:MAG: hypothetical protein ACKO37_00465 [Vampirovibrionales bacterium]
MLSHVYTTLHPYHTVRHTSVMPHVASRRFGEAQEAFQKRQAQRQLLSSADTTISLTPWIHHTPEEALKMPFQEAWKTLEARVGKHTIEHALTLACKGASIPLQAPSHEPIAYRHSPVWMDKAKIVGVPHTVTGSYFHTVQYAMSIPEGSIHLLPFTEHSGSVYAATSWKPDATYIHPELSRKGLSTPEAQLAFTISMLHALGKRVGFDLVPHVDRFAEPVFTAPSLFEWLHINPKTHRLVTPQNRDTTHEAVEALLITYLKTHGSALGTPLSPETLQGKTFFSLPESTKSELLFGTGTLESRTAHRVKLMQWIRQHGYDPVAQAGAAPYRPVTLKKMVPDGHGQWWPEFTLLGLKKGMRDDIVGNVTPYKLYHVFPDGTPDITRPNVEAWNYLTRHTEDWVKRYQFDFLRADMAHIQQTHSNPQQPYDTHQPPEFYHVLKKHLQTQGHPAFATFAESFLLHGIVSGAKDMAHKGFNGVLGPFQYIASESKDYRRNLYDWLERSLFSRDPFKVSLSSMTTDSDQAHHNDLFNNTAAHTLRLFLGYFLPLPAYNGMGVESRGKDAMMYSSDTLDAMPKAFQWTTDTERFHATAKLRQCWERYRTLLEHGQTTVLPTGNPDLLVWVTHQFHTKSPALLAMANLNLHEAQSLKTLEALTPEAYQACNTREPVFQSHSNTSSHQAPNQVTQVFLAPGEVRLYPMKDLVPHT